jgi:hypothetical protein
MSANNLLVEQAFQASFRELGDVDVLVNCAGTSVRLLMMMLPLMISVILDGDDRYGDSDHHHHHLLSSSSSPS